MLIVLFSFPVEARAGMFSFMAELFASEAKSETIKNSKDSEETLSLEAIPNINPNPNQLKSDFSISGNALESSNGPEGVAAAYVEKGFSDQISVYTVRDGDTVQDIASMFKVSVNTILWANNIKGSKDLKKDQSIIILPISGVKYVVKKGDNLQSIANSFKGDLSEILSFNDFEEGHLIKVGDEIIIPDGEISTSKIAPTTKIIKAIGKDVSGYFTRPVVGGTRTQGLHGGCGCGVDIAAKVGTPIYAAANGRVLIAIMGGWHGGYGNYIVVAHDNGTQSLYAHLSSVDVVSGQLVTKGNKIGEMGSSGNSTGSHIHFEIRGGRNPF